MPNQRRVDGLASMARYVAFHGEACAHANLASDPPRANRRHPLGLLTQSRRCPIILLGVTSLTGNVEVDKASRIKIAYEVHGLQGKGAFEFEGQMVDAPVFKQVSESSCDTGFC